MTDSLWVAKRSTARGGNESTVYDKGDAEAFIQGACSSLMTEELVAQEPDVYEYTIRTLAAPVLTSVSYSSITGRSVLQGTGLAGTKSITITYCESDKVVVYTRESILNDHNGSISDTEISLEVPSSVGEYATRYMVATNSGSASIVVPVAAGAFSSGFSNGFY